MAGRKVSEYVYLDHKSRPILRKVRFDPKQFVMDSWSDKLGHWVPTILDAQLARADRAMYHLPELNRPGCDGGSQSWEG